MSAEPIALHEQLNHAATILYGDEGGFSEDQAVFSGAEGIE